MAVDAFTEGETMISDDSLIHRFALAKSGACLVANEVIN